MPSTSATSTSALVADAKPPLGSMRSHSKEAEQRWAHVGRQHSERCRYRTGLRHTSLFGDGRIADTADANANQAWLGPSEQRRRARRNPF
jgi:hypothetical protein